MKRYRLRKVLAFTLTLIILMSATLINASASNKSSTGAGVTFFDPNPTIYKVTFYSNDDRVDTTLGEVEVVEGNRIGNNNMPQNPTREGYRFIGWSTRTDTRGTTVNGSTVVSADLSVYAQWEELPPPPTPTPQPTPQPPSQPTPQPPPQIPSQPITEPTPEPVTPTPQPPAPTPAPTPAPSPEPEEDEEDNRDEGNDAQGQEQRSDERVAGALVRQDPPPPADPPQDGGSPPSQQDNTIVTEELPARTSFFEINDQMIPTVNFGGRTIALFAPLGVKSWALLNLILSILGIAFVVITTIRTLKQKKKDSEEDVAENGAQFHDEETGNKRNRLTWLALAAVAALAGILLFFLTQDMRSMMVLTDWWTLIHIIFFVAIVIACPLVFKKQEKEEEDVDLTEVHREQSHEELLEELHGLHHTI